MPPINNQALVPLVTSFTLSRLMAGRPLSSEILETAVEGVPMVTREGFFREVLSATPYPEDAQSTANRLWRPEQLIADLAQIAKGAKGARQNCHPFDYGIPISDPDPRINSVLKDIIEERNAEGRVRPASLCSLANAYVKARRHDEALAYFRRAIRIEPHPRAFAGLAILYRQVDQLDDALGAIDEAIRRNKGRFARDHFEKGLILRKMDCYEDALRSFDRAIALEKGRFANSFLERAVTYRRLSRWEEALQDADAAIRLNAHRPQAHCERARVLRRLRRLEEAMASIRTALALDPLCPFSQQEWERIEIEKTR